MQQLDLQLKQFQDFTPTPGTLVTAMYVTGLHRDTEKPIYVARKQSERMKQRRILEGQLHGKKASRQGREKPSSRSAYGKKKKRKKG